MKTEDLTESEKSVKSSAFLWENESGRSVNRESYLWIKSILESCGVEIEENKTEVQLSDGTRREYTFGNEVDMWEARYIRVRTDGLWTEIFLLLI